MKISLTDSVWISDFNLHIFLTKAPSTRIRIFLNAKIFLSRLKKFNNKKPLFTLGSVYSTSASGAEQTTETNISNPT